MLSFHRSDPEGPAPRTPHHDLLIPLALMILATCTFFWRLGEGSLFDYDEGIHAQMAQEMIWRRDLLTPYLAGEPHFTKPPLYMWLTIVAFKIFGVTEFAARFWPALAGVGLVLLTYLLGKDLAGRSTGLGAALLLLIVSNLPFSYYYSLVSVGRMAMMTTILALCGTATMWLAWRGHRDRRYLILIGLPVGLAVMTKNVAGLMPVAALTLYGLLTVPLRRWPWRELGLAAALAGAIALPWHLAQTLSCGMEFIRAYILNNIFSRALSNLEAQYRNRPAWFYLDVIRQGFSYMAYILPLAALYGAWQARRHEQVPLLLLLWALVPLAIYSLSRTRLPWYIMEAYPALALLGAWFLVRVLRGRAALALIAAFMILFGWRLPSARNGSAEVKRVAGAVQCLAGRDDVVSLYMADREDARPTALFYAGRPVRAVLYHSGGRERALTGARFLLTNQSTWDAGGIPGEVLCREGKQLLVQLEP